MKFVSIFKLDPAAPLGPPDEAGMRAMGALIGELMAAGKLVDTGGILPQGDSMRVQRAGGRTTVTDGPFTETKELIGGFAVFQVQSKDEAIECTRRFLDLVGAGACELHEVSETPNVS